VKGTDVICRIAVITIVAGRHHHLRAQDASLAEADRRFDLRVVVAMDDPSITAVVADGPFGSAERSIVIERPRSNDGRLALADARNAGASAAIEGGADLLVFLDVDCLAAPDLLSTYESALARVGERTTRPAVLCSTVAYLPRLPPGRTAYSPADLEAAKPHAARPVLDRGDMRRADPRLFWSLSFAVCRADWQLTAGFDEGYTGYGGEDTDFGQRIVASGGSVWWTGGGLAYHQWHPVSDPPIEHLDDIIRNANRFQRRWGWFPMDGWLKTFRAMGVATYDAERGAWHAVR
jgi:GT2 family glycosyltransferase